jgi:hypothetical protein
VVDVGVDRSRSFRCGSTQTQCVRMIKKNDRTMALVKLTCLAPYIELLVVGETLMTTDVTHYFNFASHRKPPITATWRGYL